VTSCAATGKILWPISTVGSDKLPDMSETDLELLAHYTRQHAEDAFAEIVRRHLRLVYSAALRRVRLPQLAEEVAQSAFIDLARNAARLKPDTILTAWLYQVTRRTAIDVVRREASRQLREQIATGMNAMNATAADWTHIEPLLDEAMHALDDKDRTTVLLRYFENKSLREVGATLGTTEDAARKRVNRAVERLREFFAKRGVTVGASGLGVVISANAVQAAPAGLAATLTSASLASGAAGTGTMLTLFKFMAMTKLKLGLLSAIILAVPFIAVVVIRKNTLPDEPGYQGKRLSEWLRSFDKTPLEWNSDLTIPANQASAEAIVQMGSQAVPFLVRELRARDSAANDSTPAYVRNRRAIQACLALGPTAKTAIPELTKRLAEHRISAMLRTSALAAMGPDAVPSLMAALTNSEPEVRRCMATTIRNGSFDAEPLVPALVKCLSDPDDYHVRTEAAMALARLRKRPDFVLPALTQNLSDTNQTVREFTAIALRQFHATPPVTR
jgi:RNA polymerase sigma factor (sigma-70 family)